MLKALQVIFSVWLLIAPNVSFAQPQNLTALARFYPEGSSIRQDGEALVLTLVISQPVPWRVRLLDGPERMVLDMREVDWAAIDSLRVEPELALRAGLFRAGWSRFVLELPQPMLVSQAQMQTGDDKTQVIIRLEPADGEDFALEATRPEPEQWALPPASAVSAPAARDKGPLMVVLDPGHGGLDPGAERGKVREAHLMLLFARELKELLLRDGRFGVVMTRTEDVFVPLEARISVARSAGADVFLSLHADALAEGEAQGATIYTLSEEASGAAAEALAERHQRDDLLAGIDLRQQDDVVAHVLMSMARTQTQPRTERLAMMLEHHIKAANLNMHRHPRQSGGFSVLKSPDIPSLLLELGFLSSERDLARLQDKDWRATMAQAILVALLNWSAEDQAMRGSQ